MNRSIKVMLAVMVAMAASAGALRAADGGAKKGSKDGAEKHEKMFGKMKEKLGLSEDQAAKVKAAFTANREASKASHERMKLSLEKLRWQVDAKADPKDLTATLDQLDGARKEMREQREKFMAGMSAILSPEQRARAALWMAKKMHTMHGEDGDEEGMRQGHEGHGDHERHEDSDREDEKSDD